MNSTLKNVYVIEEETINTHSRRSGICAEIENLQRIYGCELIQEGGILLCLPQVAMATGQTLFHRFYFTQSMADHDVENMAMAAIFLASKLEECVRKPRAIVSVFYTLKKRRQMLRNNCHGEIVPLDISMAQFHELKEDLLRCEFVILKNLGFYTCVEHPHKFLLNYLKVLLVEKNSKLVQTAWNYMNDSLRTISCVRFRPEVIASACIYMAARMLQVSLPEDPYPWWELFDANLDDINQICWSISQLYSYPQAEYIRILGADSSFASSPHQY